MTRASMVLMGLLLVGAAIALMCPAPAHAIQSTNTMSSAAGVYSTDMASYQPHASHMTESFATSVNMTLQEQIDYISSRFGSTDRVGVLRNAIPRWGRPSEFQASGDYVTEIAITAAYGLILFVITLLMWIIWSLIVCCCCKPNAEKYTASQVRWPKITGFISTLIIIAFSIVGFIYSEQFDTQISGNGGVGSITDDVLNHVNDFFSRVDVAIQNVSYEVGQLAPDVKVRLDSFTDLAGGLPDLLGNFTEFANDVGAIDPIVVQTVDPQFGQSNSTSYPCSACSTFKNQILNLVTDLNNQATPIYNQIDTTKASAYNDVVNAVPSIQKAVDDASKQVADIQTQSTTYHGKVDDYKKNVDDYEVKRRWVVIGLFALPCLIGLLFVICSIGRKSEGCTKVLIHLCFFAGLFMWLLFMIHLPIAQVLADSCHYLDGVDVDLVHKSSLSTSITKPLVACLTQSSILDAIGVDTSIQYTKYITFPVVPDVNTLLNRSDIDSLNAQIQALDMSAFGGYNATEKWVRLADLNSNTQQPPYFDTFDLNNVSLCNYLKYLPSGQSVSDTVRFDRSFILTALNAEASFNHSINGAKQNMTHIVFLYDTLNNKTVSLLNDMGGLKSVIQPLLDAGQHVLDQAYCSPLDDDYGHMKGVFCNKLVVSISGLAMASFFVGIFLFGLNFSCWNLQYRLQHGPESIGTSVAAFDPNAAATAAPPGAYGVEMVPLPDRLNSPSVASPSGMVTTSPRPTSPSDVGVRMASPSMVQGQVVSDNTTLIHLEPSPSQIAAPKDI